jgi:tRNA(Ile)-lysidine synthase
LVAFSGGSDSRALLGLLAARGGARRLAAAYLDHGLRPKVERAAELEHVRRVCAGLGLSLRVGCLPPGSLAAEARGRSLEQVARERRYRFLMEVAREQDCDYIALGHTADDQAETLIMRFFQGAGLGGLGGIPERRGPFIRPLLACRRAELQAWLAERGLDYRTDSSNLQPQHLRNAVRLRLIPVLEELFPGFRGSLAELAESFRQVRNLLEAEAAARLRWRRSGQGWAVDAEAFLAASPLLRRQSLFAPLAAFGVRGGRLPARFLAGSAASGGSPQLAGRGVRLRRRGRQFVLERDIVGVGKKGYLITIEPHHRYAAAGRVIESGAGASGRGWLALESRPECAPLVLRSATAADRLRTESGSTAVSKLCSAWRIPLTERWKLPILADRGGVLAVLGGGLGGTDRFRPGALGGAGKAAVRIAGLEAE